MMQIKFTQFPIHSVQLQERDIFCNYFLDFSGLSSYFPRIFLHGNIGYKKRCDLTLATSSFPKIKNLSSICQLVITQFFYPFD